MATRRKTKTRWLRTRIEKEGFPFCMCCIFKAKFLHHYCKVSDQDGLSAIVFSGSIRPFLYAFGPWQCFTFSNSTYWPLLKQHRWVLSCHSSGRGTAGVSTFPSPLSGALHLLSSAEGSLTWSRSIPTTTPACGRCRKPEIIFSYGSLYVTGSQNLSHGRLWVSCPSCCQQIPLTCCHRAALSLWCISALSSPSCQGPRHVTMAAARVTVAADKGFPWEIKPTP